MLSERLELNGVLLTNDNRKMSRTEVKRRIRSTSSMDSVLNDGGGLFGVDIVLWDNAAG